MPAERPVSALLSDIAGNVQDIVRAELRLAKTEITAEVGRASSGGLMVGLGVLMLAVSGLFALLAIVYALSLVMPAWAAALIVAAGEGLMAAVFVGVGIKRFKAARAAPRTRESIKENVEWAKQQLR
jgi:uncharacterized membrane protein YqjE